MFPSSSPHHMRTTYFRIVWNSGHVNLVLRIVLRVVRKGSGGSPDALEPGKAAFCSEALDEDTLVHCRGWIILLVR